MGNTRKIHNSDQWHARRWAAVCALADPGSYSLGISLAHKGCKSKFSLILLMERVALSVCAHAS